MYEIRDVDVSDEAQVRGWYDLWRAGQAHRPADLVPSWTASRTPLSTPRADFDVSLFGAFDGDVQVGAGMVNLPMEDNPTVAYAEVVAHPAGRGRGVGTAVLAEVERRSREAGRTRVLVEVFVPGDDEVEQSGDAAFAEARGYALANREGSKAVDLARSERLWPALTAEVSAALGDYRLVGWRDTCPEEHLAGFGAAVSRAMSLIPQGDLDLEDREWTTERIRAAEEHRVSIGIATFEAAAIAPDGTVAGLTGLRVNTRDPRVAHVGITMVLPEHRGHRLGLATKLVSHQALRAAFPECHLVVTSNAEVNDHMNAINEAMGYRRLETLLEYHKRV